MAHNKRSRRSRNLRGTSQQVHKRRQWLLDTFGNGKTALCSFGCGTEVDMETMSIDRFPIPGYLGGTYHRGNIRPACMPCNTQHGAELNEKGARYKWEPNIM